MQGKWIRLMTMPVIIVGLGGCGADQSVEPNSGVTIGGGGGGRRGSGAPAVPSGNPKKSDKPATPKTPAKVDSAIDQANPNDLFTLTDGEPNFTIVSDGANTFLATAPAKGVDSTQFTFIPPPADNSPTNSVRNPATDLPSNPAPKRFKLPDGFTAVENTELSDKGFPRHIRCEKDGSLMVLIPSSITTQGTDDGPSNAGPKFAAFLDPYYIDVAEITLAQYKEFRGWWRESKKRTLDLPINANAPDDHPALGITWANARNYTLWAQKQLPTEAEWEKAARGPDGFLHPWGNGRAAWSPPRTLNQIDPVMSFRADISPYGVFDLAGNAREWCSDFYAPTAYTEATRNGETVVRNWPGPKRGRVESHRVVKGNGPNWMAWHRSSANMRESAPDIGFRCVLRGFSDQNANSDSESNVRRKTGF